MGDVTEFPQKQTNEMSSLMSLLSCDDCHMEWIGMYETGKTVSDLHCPYCEGENLTNRQGEREVFFYDYER
jgi:hypothetical protein